MIWLVGFKTVSKIAWKGQTTCRRCLQAGSHNLNEQTEWGTLFFVPLVPIRRQRQLVCYACGLQTMLSKPEAEQLINR